MPVKASLRFGVSVVVVVLLAAVASLAPSSSVTGEQATGTIQGTVSVAAAPPPGTLEVTMDQPVCGERVPDETVVADGSGGVANAVITVGGVPWPAGSTAAVVTNEGCRFVPHVQIVHLGGTVEITSTDATLHTTHAYDDRNRTLFNVAIPVPGLNIQRRLPRPGIVRLECDSHVWMRGYLVVTEDMTATTGFDGRFRLTGVPAGTYELSVWHEQLQGTSQTVTVSPGTTADVTFRLEEGRTAD